jgi:capsular exopolysaccharide synthesis family protein
MSAQGSPLAELKLDLKTLKAISQPTDSSAESIRALRTHLMARHVGAGHRALAVCAASGGVGCTYVASNLAVALSQIGVNTLLMDGNLREPALDGVFRLPKPRDGLQQCLQGQAIDVTEYGQFIESEILPSLSIMYAGGAARNAQELLAGDNFKTLMDACLRDFDATIIDTPPANSCSDASRIANVVSYCLIVARRDKSYVNDIKVLASQLKEHHGQVVGTVLNDS